LGLRSRAREFQVFAAQWLAYALPCRRFAVTLVGANARLGADVDRYSFIVVDLHHQLLAGLCRRTEILEMDTTDPEALCRAGFTISQLSGDFLPPSRHSIGHCFCTPVLFWH
jgi:hypothetical protein